ncbi:MAG: GTPase Era [Pseudomonadales bacterium]|nr:GTPase Era [Pseudomonadales bacterium]
MTEPTRCGYVALLGRPNVGKSTLLNHVLRQKIAITSRKPQTTRHNLLGIDTQAQDQAIYIDTPGIHGHDGKALNRYMVGEAQRVLPDVDVRVLLLETGQWTSGDDFVLELLAKSPGRNIAVISKTDLVKKKEQLLPQMQRLDQSELFEHIIPMSALRNDGIDEFRREVFQMLPEAPHLFDGEQLTDRSERHLVEEIIREKVMRQLGDEVPHSTAVVVERFVTGPELTEIHADIYVERNGQKRIVIGQEGQKLKLIGQEARVDIERLVDNKVMLHLWVKVRKGWTNNAGMMRRLGYD